MEKVVIDKSGTVLEIEVKTNVSKAIKDMDKLFRSLKKLEKIDVSNIETLNKINISNLVKIEQQIQTLNDEINRLQKAGTIDFTSAANGLDSKNPSGIDTSILDKQADSCIVLSDYISGVSLDFEKLIQDMASVDSLGELDKIFGNMLSNAFGPFRTMLDDTLQHVIGFAQKVTEALGAIFGWKFEVESTGGTFDDWSSNAQNVAASTGVAAKNVEKMSKGIRAFDELNVITTQDTSYNSGGAGNSGTSIDGEFVKTETIWDNYKSDIDTLSKLGSYIEETLTEAMNQINWSRIYEGARNFGKGFADFLNALISPDLFGAVGQTIAKALNTAIYAALSFGQNFNFENFGYSIASAINNFFANFDFAELANVIDVWVQGVWTTIKNALKKIEWSTVWEGVKEFITHLDIETVEIVVGAFAISKAIGLILKFDFIEWVSSKFTEFLTSVPVVIKNIKILASGGLLESGGFFAKLANTFAMTASGAGTLGESITAIFGTAALPIIAVVLAIAALAIGLGYVFTKSEEVRESFSQAIAAIREGLQPALEFLTETVLPDLQAGWDRILEVLAPLGEFLQEMFTSIWMDMINPALQYIGETVLPKVTEAFENLWNNVLVPLGSFLMDVLEPIIQVISEKFSMIWQNVIVPLADTIKNVLAKAFEGMCDIFNNVVIPIVHTVIEVFQFLWDNVLSPIVSFLWDNLKPVFENVFHTIGNIITNIGDIFGGLIDFITGIFCGDWKKAWNGIVDVFKGVFNLIPSIAEGVINGTINLVNNIIHGFNKLTSVVGIPAIPDIPKVELPRLATGGLVYRPTIAQIGEAGKEGVLPLTNKAAMSQLVDEIMISSGAIGTAQNGGDFARGIEEAAYRGIMRGIRESGGIKAEATFQVEGDPNKIFSCWQKEYKTRARATQKNLIPIF